MMQMHDKQAVINVLTKCTVWCPRKEHAQSDEWLKSWVEPLTWLPRALLAAAVEVVADSRQVATDDDL